MKAIECLKTRRSIRNYLDKPVPKEVIEDIIDCARMSPTANNVQPWEFVVVTDVTTKKKLADITDYGKFIANAPVCIIVFCKDTKYYLEDGSAATENILLSAWVHELGSCWVAGDKKKYADEVRQLLGVPVGYKLISLIPIGFPKSQGVSNKRSLNEMIHWEKWKRYGI